MAFRKLLEDRRGAVALIFGIALLPVMSLVGSSIDYLQALRVRNHLQAAVDAAALAAASLRADDSYRNAVGQNAFNANFDSGGYGLALQPTVTLNGDTVTVDAAGLVPTAFLGLVGIESVDIGVTATATRAQGLPACLLALNPTDPGTVHLQGTTRLTARDCAVQANSAHGSALLSRGASSATADAFCAVGGHSGSGFSPNPKHNCPKVDDPFEHLPVPADLACDPAKPTQFKKGTYTAWPGVYCGGIDIMTHAEVHFMPGVYVIRDGQLNMRAHSTAMGEEVTFYFYGQNTGLTILSHSVVDITAPKRGDYAAMAFAQHHASNPGNVNTIQGGGGVRIVGLLYFPTQVLDIGGAGTFGATSPYIGLVADSISLRGNGRLAVRVDHRAAGFENVLPNILGSVRLVN